jgi:uncharacterized protein with GYD domain
MPSFVLMTKMRPETLRSPDDRKKMGKEWFKKVREACPEVKWIAHYALLGPYDFMDIYDAPDVETAHKVSLISRAEGALTAESWQAIPYESFLDLLEKLR